MSLHRDHLRPAHAAYRTDDPVTRTYAEGIIAAAHGWTICPHTGGRYRREWQMGYRDAQRTQHHRSKAA